MSYTGVSEMPDYEGINENREGRPVRYGPEKNSCDLPLKIKIKNLTELLVEL